jgi:putative addiction module component (TIGR02574 family)
MAIPAIDLDKLSTDERLELIERVWDSLSNRSEAIPLTNQQRLDLDELERNGPDGLSWEEVVREARRAP